MEYREINAPAACNRRPLASGCGALRGYNRRYTPPSIAQDLTIPLIAESARRESLRLKGHSQCGRGDHKRVDAETMAASTLHAFCCDCEPEQETAGLRDRPKWHVSTE